MINVKHVIERSAMALHFRKCPNFVKNAIVFTLVTAPNCRLAEQKTRAEQQGILDNYLTLHTVTVVNLQTDGIPRPPNVN